MFPSMAYLLGFFWADGYTVRNSFGFEVVKNDAECVQNVLDVAQQNYSFSDRQRPNRQPQRSIRLHVNQDLVRHLHDIGLVSNRRSSPNLESIPANQLRYFVLGFFDGDGNLYHNERWGLNQCTFSGQYEQDWSYLAAILSDQGISTSQQRMITKAGHKYSCVRFTGLKRIKVFCDYLYPDGFEFGLKRKFDVIRTMTDKRLR